MNPRCRKYYDVGSKTPVLGGDTFVKYWSSFTRVLRRAMLFLLTVSYLPVARVTLENFSSEYTTSVLTLYKCVRGALEVAVSYPHALVSE